MWQQSPLLLGKGRLRSPNFWLRGFWIYSILLGYRVRLCSRYLNIRREDGEPEPFLLICNSRWLWCYLLLRSYRMINRRVQNRTRTVLYSLFLISKLYKRARRGSLKLEKIDKNFCSTTKRHLNYNFIQEIKRVPDNGQKKKAQNVANMILHFNLR